ncbi:ATP-dependent helicase HrpB [Bartonella sp. TP]|uniref:ATP-dependent helicase HrpB n=1 Tax=Bartonella sp. TP TaxID=3057550 RepID=UPI0025AF92C6|nr:ATP-dependent helicase HrpB [Bartonella sp. TP]WJW80439.1 ATP-dependent helicase HrpB [Bartonella sp. TP]
MQEKLAKIISQNKLPIMRSFAEFLAKQACHNIILLQAPTGSGKTTLLPLFLLQQGLGKIIIAVPRRIAAKSIATYLSQLLGSKLGETIGYSVKFEHKAGAQTQILLVTCGILERMLLQNPELPGYKYIIFDEFHERSASSDFALALALESMAVLRPDLRICIMSASLDISSLQAFLPQASLIQTQGRCHPIEIIYQAPPVNNVNFNQYITKIILTALDKYADDILVFLPGQKEIAAVAALAQQALPKAIELHQLHSNIGSQATAAIFSPSNKRRVIISSSIAESSITLENIGVVIDSGLSRRAVFSPQSNNVYLVTQKASLSAIEQRAGRAGRLRPGVAIRLWDKATNISRPAFDSPEILQTDLSKLMLDAAANGIINLANLPFLTPPPEAMLAQAKTQLLRYNAITASGHITEHGKELQKLNLPLPLSKMLLYARSKNCMKEAALLGQMLEEPSFASHIIDISLRFETLRNHKGAAAAKLRRYSERFAAADQMQPLAPSLIGELLLQAFPEQIAKACGSGYYLLSNGSRAYLDESCNLASSVFLIIAKLHGAQGKQRIVAACPIDKTLIENRPDLIKQYEKIYYDKASGNFRAILTTTIGAIELQKQQLPRPTSAEFSILASKAIKEHGLELLGHSIEIEALLSRLAWLQNSFAEFKPIINAEYLSQNENWLQPYLAGLQSFGELSWQNIKNAILNIWPYELQEKAATLAPEFYQTSKGKVAIDYTTPQPRVRLKAQELYGVRQRDFIGAGKYPLQFEILSPARRPIQITDNVPNFWRSSWPQIAREMRARYPKHFWPLEP